MARTVKRPIPPTLAGVAAILLAAPPAAGAERLAMLDVRAAEPRPGSAITLEIERETPMSAFRYRAGSGPTRSPLAAGGTGHRGNSLRIDLFRLRVTRAPAGGGDAVSPDAFPPSVLRIRVGQGATPQSKRVGVALPMAPNLMLESRFGPDGESDTSVRFTLYY